MVVAVPEGHRVPVALAVAAIGVAGWVLVSVERATRPYRPSTSRVERPRWPR